MKRAHTNGPWQATHRRTMGDPMLPFLIYNVGKEGDPPLACVSNAEIAMKPDELEANALLMAASPEMLEALEKLIALAASQLDQSATHDGLENCKALADARRAIAKATEANA